MLAEKLAGRGRDERGVHAGKARLQHIAGDGVLQPREALHGLEAFLLRLEHRRERLAGGSQHVVGVEGAVGHVGNSRVGFL